MELSFQQVLADFSMLAVLLLVGVWLRNWFKPLRKYFIPAAIVGGAVGIFLGPQVLGLVEINPAIFTTYAAVLTQVVFASAFIGRSVPNGREIVRIGGAQTAFAVICNFMQVGLGLAIAALFSLHSGFGMQMVLAFQGGPGIPTAFAPMYESLGWVGKDAMAVGETLAVAGLISAIFLGLIFANIGARRGMFQSKRMNRLNADVDSQFIPEDKQRTYGKVIVNMDAASPLAYAFGFIALAVILGFYSQKFLASIWPQLRYVPAFAYCLIYSFAIQLALQKTGLNKYVDRGSVAALQGLALDLLITSAVVAVSLTVVVTYAVPLLVIFAVGLAWNVVWLMWLAPRMLPGAWLEKGLAEFGQATGSNSEALMLLRTVDPELSTDAADAFAIKMFLTSPTMIPLMVFMSSFSVNAGIGTAIVYMFVGSIAVLVFARLVGWWNKESDVKWFKTNISA